MPPPTSAYDEDRLEIDGIDRDFLRTMLWLETMRRTEPRATFDPARTYARRRRQLGWLCTLMQSLVVLLSFQISGVAHRIADTVFADECAADCGDDGDDGDESDCPPGCPSCHVCVHAQALYVPRGIAAPLPPTTMLAPAAAIDDDAPLLSFRDSVFRPPRV